MRKLSLYFSYLTAFVMAVAAVLKITHLPGAAQALFISGLVLSLYFPLYIIDRTSEGFQRSIRPDYVVGGIAAGVIDLGITFRLWHLPGADVLLLAGLLSFSLLFIPMLWLRQAKRQGANRAALTAGAIALSAFSAGLLCKLQHWPGATLLLTVGAVLLFLVYYPLCLAKPATEENHRRIRSGAFVVITGLLLTLYFIKSIEIHDTDEVKSSTTSFMQH